MGVCKGVGDPAGRLRDGRGQETPHPALSRPSETCPRRAVHMSVTQARQPGDPSGLLDTGHKRGVRTVARLHHTSSPSSSGHEVTHTKEGGTSSLISLSLKASQHLRPALLHFM